MANDIIRIYDVSDNTVLFKGDSFADALREKYFPKFNTFMPSLFSEDFLSDLCDAVEEAREIPSDEFFVKKQAKETLDIDLVRKECNFEIRLMRVYASKLYDDNPGVFNQFNFSGHKKVRNSNENMLRYFHNFVNTINERAEEMVAKGLPAGKPQELRNLLTSYYKEYDEQQSVMRKRISLTDHRIKALNQIWELMKEVSSVREFALPDDPAGQAIFALPQPEKKNTTQEDTEE